MSETNKQNLGSLLKKCREDKRFTLRVVEDKTEISNAYLSQLEGNKIKKPSPNVLNKLSGLYEIQYSILMKLAGYPVPETEEQGVLYSRIGETTREEDDALVEYLEFLRAKRNRSN
jgi:HTH-type transcriptional regulator, competence development regulator